MMTFAIVYAVTGKITRDFTIDDFKAKAITTTGTVFTKAGL